MKQRMPCHIQIAKIMKQINLIAILQPAGLVELLAVKLGGGEVEWMD